MSAFKQAGSLPLFKLIVCSFLLFSGSTVADERILGYHSDILVNVDGSLLVTETLRVRSEGREIRRGIFR
ncbi:MAG: hypothetical protein HKO88_05015, partial [Xanthomonadales bacterium]|nr:hypothetical protein [Xanthomonadales bacterium]